MFKLKQAVAGLGMCAFITGAAQAATMPTLVEGFDGPGVPAGWVVVNNSAPVGATSWFKGNPAVFPAAAGSPDSYVAANFLAAGVGGNISDWLITPTVALGNGFNLAFQTRSSGFFPDRLQVRLSTNGSSTNVGGTAASVGDFTTLLLDINPTLTPGGFASAWVPYSLDLASIAAGSTGRFAFRYFVSDTDNNADYIGIDSVVITAIPEPETTLLLALGLSALGLGLRRRSHR